MKIGSRFKKVSIGGSEVGLRRDRHGVVHMRGADDLDFARALGFAHACDRMLQMTLLRIAGRGQICELLRDEEETFAIDVYMRGMAFAADAEADVAGLSPEGLRFAEAYCTGVNYYLQEHGYPWEYGICRHRPGPWRVADCLLTIQIMTYVGLAQNQEDIERFLIQALHGGVDPAALEGLFSPHLDGMTDGHVDLIKQLHLVNTLIPPALRFLPAVPSLSCSNNWVLAPERSASGHVLQCNDPHLECNRLPAIWYEFVMETAHGSRMGASMPGVPGLVMGRTEHLSLGFTYGFMDTVDFFIEDCRAGEYRRGETYHPFTAYREVIHRKRHPSATVIRFENELGVLDTDPLRASFPDGFHLLRARSDRKRSARAIDSLLGVLQAKTVMEAQSVLSEMPISANWLIGDRQGNIGYQQSGVLPQRAHSGLHPLPAWEAENRWQGTVPAGRLASVLNPAEGFLVTANGDHNQEGLPLSINMPMAAYREERIGELLRDRHRHTVEGMKSIQTDLHSRQAAAFMELVLPHLPDSETGSVLRSWNLCYDRHSRGATLFESIYGKLLREVFRPLFGEAVWDDVAGSTGVLALYYGVFDRALLDRGSPWYLGGVKREILQRVLREVLAGFPPDRIPTWGETQQVRMNNIFFAGRLPRVLGFDHGPVHLQGGRATVMQANVFASHGRLTSVAPSYRYIADLASEEIHTALAGGPSDRRFSRWYKRGISAWLANEYKVLAANGPPRPLTT